MTKREKLLYDWLHQACALLSVEARDHQENHQCLPMQRRNIAKTLRGFVVAATNVLDEAKQEVS